MTENSKESLIENWYQVLLQKGKSDHTLQAYRRGITHFMQWYEQVYKADFDVKLIMPRDVRNWKSQQQSVEKMAPATINLRLVAVSRFFSWAVHENLCRENPTDEVGTVRLETHQAKGLKSNQLRKLLRASKEDLRDYAILELMAGTGLRVGELLALQIGDLKLGERSGSVIVRQGKQGNYREIPLTSDVRKAVADYLRNEHPDPKNAQAPLWSGRNG